MANVQVRTRCTICRAPFETLRAVNRALIERQPYKEIGKQFSLGAKAIERHAQNHLAQRLAAAWRRREAILQVDTESLLCDLLATKIKLQGILNDWKPAPADGDPKKKSDLNGAASVAREITSAVRAFSELQQLAAGAELVAPPTFQIEVVYTHGKPQEDLPAENIVIVREPALPAVIDVKVDPGSRTQ